jgi:hypothetical protein
MEVYPVNEELEAAERHAPPEVMLADPNGSGALVTFSA